MHGQLSFSGGLSQQSCGKILIFPWSTLAKPGRNSTSFQISSSILTIFVKAFKVSFVQTQDLQAEPKFGFYLGILGNYWKCLKTFRIVESFRKFLEIYGTFLKFLKTSRNFKNNFHLLKTFDKFWKSTGFLEIARRCRRFIFEITNYFEIEI